MDSCSSLGATAVQEQEPPANTHTENAPGQSNQMVLRVHRSTRLHTQLGEPHIAVQRTIELSTHVSAKCLLDAIHLEISDMGPFPRLLVAKCMAAPAVLLCDCLLYVPHLCSCEAISPRFFQASHFGAPLACFHGCARGLCCILGEDRQRGVSVVCGPSPLLVIYPGLVSRA